MKIIWTTEAENNLNQIGDYIAKNNPGAALQHVNNLREQVKPLRSKKSVKIGRILPELDREDVRELIYKNYRIIYQIAGDDVYILKISEGHQLLKLNSGGSENDQ